MKYYIFYVEGCEQKEISFAEKAEAQSFLNIWLEKHNTLDDKGDNWIDKVFYGENLKSILTVNLSKIEEG